jgi:DNA-binding NtrC family response regulator
LQGLIENDGAAEDESIRKWLRFMLVNGGKEKTFDSCVDHIAAMLISEALELSNDNRSQAARLLGISRPTLHAKMEKFHITSGFNNRA